MEGQDGRRGRRHEGRRRVGRHILLARHHRKHAARIGLRQAGASRAQGAHIRHLGQKPRGHRRGAHGCHPAAIHQKPNVSHLPNGAQRGGAGILVWHVPLLRLAHGLCGPRHGCGVHGHPRHYAHHGLHLSVAGQEVVLLHQRVSVWVAAAGGGHVCEA